jgi:DNA-binding IscR family transcriptional regulator
MGRPGRADGYVLARPPERISLGDVLDATSGPLRLMDCVDDPSVCEHAATCASRHVWVDLTEELRRVLARYALADFARRPCAGCRASAERAQAARVTQRNATRACTKNAKKWRFVQSYE